MNLKILFGVVAAIAIIISAIGYISNVGDETNKNIDLSGFNNSIKQITQIQNTANKVYNATLSENQDNSLLLYRYYTAGVNSLRAMVQTLNAVPVIIGDSIGAMAGVGITTGAVNGDTSWLIGMVVLVFILAVIILMISIFVNWRLSEG